MEEELVVHPKVDQIALPRLVGLVNGVDGSWSEYRGGLGCDSRWLSKQLKSFSLSDQAVRDPMHGELAARGYDIHELLKVSRRYRAKEEEERGGRREQSPPGKASTSSTSSTDTANPLEKQEKMAAKM